VRKNIRSTIKNTSAELRVHSVVSALVPGRQEFGDRIGMKAFKEKEVFETAMVETGLQDGEIVCSPHLQKA